MASILQRSLRAPPVHSFPVVSPPSLQLTLIRCFRRDQGRIEVILNDDIRGLGYKNDIVQVRRGYARNILVPRNKAAYASSDNRRARSLPQLQLQRPPAALRHTATADTATISSTTPATAASNHSRRYLQELTAHLSRLPLVFYREASAATGRFTGRPIDTLAVYRHLITRHKAYFLHYTDITLPPHPINTLGPHTLQVRVRAVEEGGSGSGEKAEVVRVQLTVVRSNESDEIARQRRAEEAEDALEAASRGEVADTDSDTQTGTSEQKGGGAKGRERAGVSKMRA